MNDDHALNLVYLLVVLVIALGALSVRRIPLGFLVRSVAAWVVIVAIVYVGVMHRYELSAGFARITDKLGLSDQSVQGRTVRIRMAPDGHFWARVRINQVERRMLIDSGATVTGLSESTATAAEVSTSAGGLPVMVETANGTIAAKRARIDHVAVGSLETANLDAIVSSSFGGLDVLGMNFLSRLKSWRVEGDTLILEPPQGSEPGADAGEAQ